MKTKILSVRFDGKVPAPTTNERIRKEREQLDEKDAGPDGFTAGQHGISYGLGKQRILIPWQRVRWCEMEQSADDSGKRTKG